MVDRKQKALELAEAALAVEPEKRTDFLSLACEGDALLQEAVETLLAEETGPVGFLEGHAAEVLEEADELKKNEEIGAFRVVERVGRGGMGEVYLATRIAADFEQRVAVKVLKKGLETAELVRRFQREKEILARLRHPGIARIFDGGTSQTGRHYLVMDYVDGEPINRFCKAHGLALKDRLALFKKVCGAVQFAHRNLVVHRDLKPGNIFVTPSREVILLDFGIAKLLAPDDLSTATQGGLALLTPEYASPEQKSGELTTTASDVYSLGVILHELVFGHRPGEKRPGQNRAVENRAVENRADEPADDPARAIAPSPGPGALRQIWNRVTERGVDRDLRTIIAHALEPEPHRRYSSAAQLATDVEKYLEGFPIEAERALWPAVLAKFIRRNRLLSGLVVLLLALSGFWSFDRVQNEKRLQKNLAKTEYIKNFMIGLFDQSDPYQTRQVSLSIEELLQNGVRRTETDREVDLETKADVLDAISQVYLSLQYPERAEELLKRSLDLREEAEQEESIGWARTRMGLALAYEGEARFEEALEELDAARRIVLTKKGPSSLLSLQIMGVEASVLGKMGKPQEALEKNHAALALAPDSQAFEYLRMKATLMNNVASAHYLLAQLEESERWARQVLELRRQTLQAGHPVMAETVNNLATILTAKGEYEEAEALYREALRDTESLLGAGHPRIAQILANLGNCIKQARRPAEAEPILRDALSRLESRLGEGHTATLVAKSNLASVLKAVGRLEEAEPLFQQVLAGQIDIYGPEHPAVAFSLNSVGATLQALGRFEEAADHLNRSLELQRKLNPDLDSTQAATLNNLAKIRYDAGDFDEAERAYLESIRAHASVLPENHPFQAYPALGLGLTLMRQERFEEACNLIQKSLEIRKAGLAPHHWLIGESQSILGECLLRLQKTEHARPLLESGFQIMAGDLANDSLPLSAARRRLYELYSALGLDSREAEILLENLREDAPLN